MTKEERISRATEFFKSGYNCSQSVVAAFADMYGFTEEQALFFSRLLLVISSTVMGHCLFTCSAASSKTFCLACWQEASVKRTAHAPRIIFFICLIFLMCEYWAKIVVKSEPNKVLACY